MLRLLSHLAPLRPVPLLSSRARRTTSHSTSKPMNPHCVLHSLLICRPSHLEGPFLCQHPESHPLRLCQLGHKKSKTSLSIVSVSSLPYRSLLVRSISFMKHISTCRRVVCLSYKLEEVQLFHSPIRTSY